MKRICTDLNERSMKQASELVRPLKPVRFGPEEP
jgi:hypothetical protein